VSIADSLCPKNDPAKTICATMFIIAVVQNIKIGDLSSTQSGLSFSSDAPGESMDVDEWLPLSNGTELGAYPSLSKAEERTLVRESTAGFAGAHYTNPLRETR
jgi:proteasome activator subunit 4